MEPQGARARQITAGSPWVEIDERLRDPSDSLLTKKWPSVFAGTPLAALLNAQRIDTVIVTGCTTSGCVRASVVDAFSNGFLTLVPEDAVGDQAQGPHDANLLDCQRRYAEVTTTDACIEYLRPRRGMRKPPLEDVTIVAIEQYGAGPWGSVHLADLGADVIKIEDPRSRGDVGRYVPPFQEGEDSLFFETFCHNKRSVSLDLTHPEARRGLRGHRALAPTPSTATCAVTGPRSCASATPTSPSVNPAIVCCALTGFGMTGPRAEEGGYDYILQGYAGWMSLTGEPDGPPVKTGLSLVDMATGYAAALALMCGLWGARRDGIGCDCDISLFETAMNLNMYVSTWHLSRGYEPERFANSAHPSIVPFQNFPTRDGWIVIACPKDKFFALLCARARPGVDDRRSALRDDGRARTSTARPASTSSRRCCSAKARRRGWSACARRASRAARSTTWPAPSAIRRRWPAISSRRPSIPCSAPCGRSAPRCASTGA